MNIALDQGEHQSKPKRFCCGAIKRLKDKCLRFHDNN